METIDSLYSAYRDMVSVLQKNKMDQAAQAAAQKADPMHGSQTGNIYRVVVDLDWVEAIESRLRNIDAAIRENRRFIEQTEEIVPIALSRKITSESVKHLARHTNLISSVEDGKVTPEKILNIQREESFAIYENRFLYTLLQRLSYFVGVRYQAVQGKPEHMVTRMDFTRQFEEKKTRSQLHMIYELQDVPDEKFRMDVDPSTLSDIQRVARIRSIIMDFMATPLMKSLTHCEQVRPPIMRTNLMTKDPNYRAALDLWTFIETYKKDGYTYIAKDFQGDMEPQVSDGLYDVTTMLNFVAHMKNNPPLEQQLQQRYAQRQEEEKARRLAEEQKRQQQEMTRLEEARKRERLLWQDNMQQMQQVFDRKMHALREENSLQLQKQSEWFEEKIRQLENQMQAQHDQMEKDFSEARASDLKAYEQRLQLERDNGLRKQAELEGQFDLATARQEEYWKERMEQCRQESRQKLDEAIAENARKTRKERQQIEAELQKLQAEYARQKAQFKEKKQQLEQAAKADREALIAQKRASDRQLRQAKTEYARNLRRLEFTYRQKAEAQDRAPEAPDQKPQHFWSKFFR